MIELENYWPGLATLALLLATVHLWFPWFDQRFAARQSRWMGLVGGIATGYVVLYLLPKITRMTTSLTDPEDTRLVVFHLQHYLLLLSAIVVYLIMEWLDKVDNVLSHSSRIFDYLVHGTYSLLIGYVFVEASTDEMFINAIIVVILGLHLLGMNHLLRERRAASYDQSGRWTFFVLILIGSGLGLVTELPEIAIDSITAFLAGIILVNVMSEELPLKYPDRLPWFIVGIFCFIAAGFVIISTIVRPPF